MRKRREKRGNIVIELTSLLDVIFIVLLIVLCGQYGANADLNEQLAEAQSISEETAVIQELYADMLDTEDSLGQLVFAAAIAVPYDKEDVTKREIKILAEGSDIQSFSLLGNDTEASVEAFRNTLTGFVETYRDKPVILSLNEGDDKILYRDEKMVKGILEELLAAYDNVYIKGSLGEE